MSPAKKRKRGGKETATSGFLAPLGIIRWHSGLAVLVVLALVAAVVAGVLLLHDPGRDAPPSSPTATIVDQLSLTMPNRDFVTSATDLLEQAGYAVDYYSGEQVTVELYRKLPTFDYDLIVLRVHSAMSTEVNPDSGEIIRGLEYVSLFTGEPYTEDKYRNELINGLVGRARYQEESGTYLFGIGPAFIEESMKGKFHDSIIVLMGCDGMSSQRTAQAFFDKGAYACVGWTGSVSASHTDAATQHLLQEILIERLTVADAVAQTAVEFGPDPWSGAELRILLDDE